MQYRRFTTGPWKKPRKYARIFLRMLTFWIPKTNPDFEDKLNQVEYFWLELEDDGTVLREIGFNSLREPVTAAPVGKNHGIFTDLNGAPEPLEEHVASADFNDHFSQLILKTFKRS